MTTETKTEEKTQAQPQDVQSAALLFMMETMRDLKNEIAELKKAQTTTLQNVSPQNATANGSRAGRPRAQGSPHVDTKTGTVYKSKASAGKALFPEFEGRELNDGRVVKMHGWIFHDIVALEPGRLIPYTGNKAHGEIDAEYVFEHAEKTVDDESEDDESDDDELAGTGSEDTESADVIPEQPKAEQPEPEQPKQQSAQPQKFQKHNPQNKLRK